jgi:hypothetical protein
VDDNFLNEMLEHIQDNLPKAKQVARLLLHDLNSHSFPFVKEKRLFQRLWMLLLLQAHIPLYPLNTVKLNFVCYIEGKDPFIDKRSGTIQVRLRRLGEFFSQRIVRRYQ